MANTLQLGNGKWATGKDTVLSFSDTNNNFKPLPFNFSRASSATVVNQSGLIETVGSGTPRIDFLGNTKGALLLEPSRTNVFTNSNAIQSMGFGFVGASIQADVTTSPDGTTNADLLKENTANGNHFMFKDFNLSSGQTYTISVFAKKNGVNRNLRFGDGGVGWSSGFNVSFDLTNGTADSGGVIESYGNGWYRCSVKGTTSATTSRLIVYNATNQTSYQGDGSSGVFFYGFQIEQGSYATSYIPTSGSAVTRVADACSQTVPDGVIGQTEGTVYWEINVETTVATSNENILNVDNGSGFGHTIYFIKSATGAILGEMYVSGVLQATFIKSNITKGVHKMAMGYANNNTSFFVDGVQVGVTDTSCTVPLMSRIQLGNGVFGQMDCLSNDVKLYNTRLSNAELASLTTI